MTAAMEHAPVAIITGAGSGIGRATCLMLAQAGFRLALVGRTEATLEETDRLIAESVLNQPETRILPADIADHEQAHAVVDMTLEHWGRLDALVNNAGQVDVCDLADVEADRLYTLFAVNVFGPMHLVARAWPAFEKQGRGRVVNVSSVSVEGPFPGLGPYAVSKCAIEGLTTAIMAEGRDRGILAFTVVPGAVETAMLRQVVSKAELPSNEVLPPEEVARVIAECVTGGRDNQAGVRIRVMPPG